MMISLASDRDFSSGAAGSRVPPPAPATPRHGASQSRNTLGLRAASPSRFPCDQVQQCRSALSSPALTYSIRCCNGAGYLRLQQRRDPRKIRHGCRTASGANVILPMPGATLEVITKPRKLWATSGVFRIGGLAGLTVLVGAVGGRAFVIAALVLLCLFSETLLCYVVHLRRNRLCLLVDL